jgi:hypothetical protein
MQYLLTEEEYKNLVPKTKYYAEMDKVKILNKQVLELSKFTCAKETQGCFGYCDFCPITKTCTEIKQFSK